MQFAAAEPLLNRTRLRLRFPCVIGHTEAIHKRASDQKRTSRPEYFRIARYTDKWKGQLCLLAGLGLRCNVRLGRFGDVQIVHERSEQLTPLFVAAAIVMKHDQPDLHVRLE